MSENNYSPFFGFEVCHFPPTFVWPASLLHISADLLSVVLSLLLSLAQPSVQCLCLPLCLAGQFKANEH